MLFELTGYHNVTTASRQEVKGTEMEKKTNKLKILEPIILASILLHEMFLILVSYSRENILCNLYLRG